MRSFLLPSGLLLASPATSSSRRRFVHQLLVKRLWAVFAVLVAGSGVVASLRAHADARDHAYYADTDANAGMGGGPSLLPIRPIRSPLYLHKRMPHLPPSSQQYQLPSSPLLYQQYRPSRWTTTTETMLTPYHPPHSHDVGRGLQENVGNNECLSPIGDILRSGQQDWDEFGGHVSISKNGQIVAVGAPYYDGGAGSSTGLVRVYENVDGRWMQRGADIEGEKAADQLSANALSNDGNILAVGAPGNDDIGDRSGRVRVYQYNVGIWQPLGATTPLVGPTAYDFFGVSVALSGNGTILAVGALNGGSNGAGQVHIFSWNGSAWINKGVPINGQNSNDSFGSSIALSESGSMLAIGAFRNDGNGSDASGSVQVFEFVTTNNNWNPLGQALYGENAGDLFGCSVSLSSDGHTVAVGARNADSNGLSNTGQVQVYQYNENAQQWAPHGSSLTGNLVDDYFGESVSLSGDGLALAVGAPQSSGGKGFLQLFQWDDMDWQTFGKALLGTEENDDLGSAVAVARDGSTVVVGGDAEDTLRPGLAMVVQLEASCQSATIIPTMSPMTTSPTISPTASPTIIPTMSPTTTSRTISPTASPTMGPTGSSTISPTTPSMTTSPTIGPFMGPTASPMMEPTTSPMTSRTTSPMASPTTSPITASPTVHPTTGPTKTSSTADRMTTGPTMGPMRTGPPMTAPTMGPLGSNPSMHPTTMSPAVSPSEGTLAPTSQGNTGPEVDATITGITMEFVSVGELTWREVIAFETVTKDWYEAYYYTLERSSLSSLKVLRDLRTSISVADQGVQTVERINTIQYDQTLVYIKLDSTSSTRDHLLRPFLDAEAKANYTAQLQTIDAFHNVEVPIPNPNIPVETQDTMEKSTSLSTGVLVGVIVGSLAFFIVVCAAGWVIQGCRKRHQQEDRNLGNDDNHNQQDYGGSDNEDSSEHPNPIMMTPMRDQTAVAVPVPNVAPRLPTFKDQTRNAGPEAQHDSPVPFAHVKPLTTHNTARLPRFKEQV